jgi:hypothetical protein
MRLLLKSLGPRVITGAADDDDQCSYGDEPAGPHGEEVAVERIDRFEESAARLLLANSENPASDGTSD